MAFVSRRQAFIRTAAPATSADWLQPLLPKLHAYPFRYAGWLPDLSGPGVDPPEILRALTTCFSALDPRLGQVSVSRLDVHQGVRSGGVLYKVSGPVYLDAPSIAGPTIVEELLKDI